MNTQSATKRNTQYPISALFSDPYRLLLVAAILVYIWIFAGLAFDQHAGMRTHKADLGQMDQAIWNTSQGRFVEEVKDDFVSTRLTDHVEPIFALIAPVLWLWDDVRALLLLQVIAVALGALPLYALALEKLDQLLPDRQRGQIWQREPLQQMTRPLALAFGLAWLLSPQLQSAVLTELHAIPFAAPLIVWAFWAVEKGKSRQFILAALLLASVKEEAALLSAGLGIGYWILGITRRRSTQYPISNTQQHIFSLAITFLSLLWFYTATFVIVPAHAAPVYETAESLYFQRYGALGNSPLDIASSFFTQPGVVWAIATEPARLAYLWRLLAGFGLFALLAPEILLLCAPVFLANLLSAYPAQYYGEFHYSAPIVPYFAVAAVYGMARLWRWLGRRLRGESGSYQQMAAASAPVMALVSLFTNSRTALRPLLAAGLGIWLLLWAGSGYLAAGRGPGGGRYDPTPVTAHHRLLLRFVEQIPADAPVTATAAVHPHLSHRRYIYQFPFGPDAAVPAQWALLDVTSNTDMAPGDVKAKVDEMLAAGWGVVDGADGFLLLRRGAAEKTIPDAFYDFVRSFNAEAQRRRGAEVQGFNAETRRRRGAEGASGKWQVAGGAPSTQYAIRNTQPLPNLQSPIPNRQSLTFLGLDLLDWPRWRQTKVTTLWRVEAGFDGSLWPLVEMRTPSGALLLDNRQLPSPALVWYPPARWQPGEIIRLESLWLFLPGEWGVAVGVGEGVPETALAGAFQRRGDDTLVPLPPPTDGSEAVPVGSFVAPGGAEIRLAAALGGPVPAGQTANLRLLWQTEQPDLLTRYQPFVHLRDDAGTIAQMDGAPRYFTPVQPDATTPDWRQFALPPDLPPGRYPAVVGLYNPGNGERLAAFDGDGQPAGNELTVGFVEVTAPLVPDQACALIPPACASQPQK